MIRLEDCSVASGRVGEESEAPGWTAAAVDLMPLKSDMGDKRLATPAGGVIHACLSSPVAAEALSCNEAIAVTVAVPDARGSECEVNIVLNRGV